MYILHLALKTNIPGVHLHSAKILLGGSGDQTSDWRAVVSTPPLLSPSLRIAPVLYIGLPSYLLVSVDDVGRPVLLLLRLLLLLLLAHLLAASEYVDDRILDERAEHEHQTRRHPDVYRLHGHHPESP